MKSRLTIEEYVSGILAGDRVVLGKAITLVESNLPEDQKQVSLLLEKIIQHTGNSIRIGITGVPGVGKSTFIETFGKLVTSMGEKIAVLTVDPSSQLTKGSILGDKTRMEELSKNSNAFIRPTASGSTLGGVANSTREAILLCEAAGYEVIIVETVGVGQSEVAVKNMVDFFLLLMLAGAGDELQGLKKGIMEMADAVVITKADGANIKSVTEAQAEYQQSLHLLPPSPFGWKKEVLTCSALHNKGIENIWELITRFQKQSISSEHFTENRVHQNVAWLHDYMDHLIRMDLQRFPSLQKELRDYEARVALQKVSVQSAAHHLLSCYHSAIKKL